MAYNYTTNTQVDDHLRKRSDEEYQQLIEQRANHVMSVMRERVDDRDMARLQSAYAFASEAHKLQKRKTGAPYIVHPLAVAEIAADELKLDVNSVITAFLHDVVEDTDYTIEDVRERFGDDVAFLVDVVTKKKKDSYRMSKQVDNYQQLLDSLHYDIRALMVKLADRLHNMRTLSSMRPDKQMKIAGETDYFYAPLANRLGLFDVKTDLENLSFKYRCPYEYNDIASALEEDVKNNNARLKVFTENIEQLLRQHDIWARAEVYYRKPYSLFRRMKSQDKDFKHLDNRYYVRVTYTYCGRNLSDKDICLKIYSILTDIYKEKPQSFNNQIDQAKENSYQSLNVMLLSEEGVWEDVQICSEHMVEISKIGCMADLGESNVAGWVLRFKQVLEEIANHSTETSFLESVTSSLYYDDIMVFTPDGRAIILPKGATAIDFAFDLHTEIGMHAKYARINGKLCSIKTELKRGDCIEIGTADEIMANIGWLDSTCTYKAKRALRNHVPTHPHLQYVRCPHCGPLPGGETIGIKDADGNIMIHRRSCQDAIDEASKHGDRIVQVEFAEDEGMSYKVAVKMKAIDRYHLLLDIINTITDKLHLLIDDIHSICTDNIVDCNISFYVHGVRDYVAALGSLYQIEGVEEVREVNDF